MALGDSITGTFESVTYPRFLVSRLGITEDEFAAEGAGGRTVAGGEERLAEIIEFDIYPNAEIFIYFLGGADIFDFVWSNDPGLAAAPSEPSYPFAEELHTLLDAMRWTMSDTLELALAQGYDTYIATYHALPAGKTPAQRVQTGSAGDPLAGDELDETQAARVNEYVDLLNDMIADLAGELNITLVDIRLDNETLLQDLDNFADCIHPSEAGAEILARRFAESLRELHTTRSMETQGAAGLSPRDLSAQ